MKIIENNILPPRGYKAITILNMIFVRHGVKLSDTDIRHEGEGAGLCRLLPSVRTGVLNPASRYAQLA